MAKLGALKNVEFTIHGSPPQDLLPLLKTDTMGSLFI